MGRRTRRYAITRVRDARSGRRSDTVAVEEPLQIRLSACGQPARDLVLAMRTPGDDYELVAGYLVSQGVVTAPDDIARQQYCGGLDDNGLQTYNTVEVTLRPDVVVPEGVLAGRAEATSACGICGTTRADDVANASLFGVGTPLAVAPEIVRSLPGRLRQQQQMFDRTGGVHAAGLFTSAGDLMVLREDIGRHNAVDKVVGWALQNDRLPLHRNVLQVSGRASFELVQKAAMAGVGALSAVGAPSSLAIDVARRTGVALYGFVTDTGYNQYWPSNT